MTAEGMTPERLRESAIGLLAAFGSPQWAVEIGAALMACADVLERFLLIPKDAPSIQLTNGPSNEWRVPAGVYYFGGPTP